MDGSVGKEALWVDDVCRAAPIRGKMAGGDPHR